MVTDRRLGKLETPVRRKSTSVTQKSLLDGAAPTASTCSIYDKNLTDKLQEGETKSCVEQKDGRHGERQNSRLFLSV